MQRTIFPPKVSKRTILGGIFWILTSEFFAGQAIAELAWKGPPSYSIVSNSISDLGVTSCGNVTVGGVLGYYCSPLYDVMNASFVLAGLFILLGVFLTLSAFAWKRSMKVGMAFLAIAGSGKITVGLNPANVNFTLHFLGALGIPIAGIGLIFIGRALRGIKWVANLSFILGLVGFFGFILFVLTSHFGIGGLIERIADYPMFVWFVIMGFLLISFKEESFDSKGIS